MKTDYKTLTNLKYIFYILVLFVSAISCECSSRKGQNDVQNQPEVSSENDRIEARRDFLKKERESIEAYIKDRKLKMQATGTGMYYTLLEDDPNPEQVESLDYVEFSYKIWLMNGTLLYSSEESGNEIVKVDRQDREIGLHEALKKLGLGDKGLFILPSHLAFGVAGDQNKVPPMTPLVYEIKVINIKKSKS